MKQAAICGVLLAACGFVYADAPGADAAARDIAQTLSGILGKQESRTVLTKQETQQLISEGARLQVNIFELLDDAYRWAIAQNRRIIIAGESMRTAAMAFDMGGKRVEAILPIEKIERVELGAVLESGQHAMDVFLNAPHSEYIEIGTAIMELHFGFKRLAPRLFDDAFGIKVKRFPVLTELAKLELYAPLKGAIYVKAIDKPKRWNLDPIRVLSSPKP